MQMNKKNVLWGWCVSLSVGSMVGCTSLFGGDSETASGQANAGAGDSTVPKSDSSAPVVVPGPDASPTPTPDASAPVADSSIPASDSAAPMPTCSATDVSVGAGCGHWTASTNGTGTWYGVWSASASDTWVVGDAGRIIHFDGATWSDVASGTKARLLAVWGSAANDVWASGDSGTLLHWDGAAWTARAPAPATGALGLDISISNIALVKLWGTSANDVWSAGDAGMIQHWDGAAWRAIAGASVTGGTLATDAFFTSISGSSSSDVYFTTYYGYLFHWDGVGMSRTNAFTMSGAAADALYGVWVSSPTERWYGMSGQYNGPFAPGGINQRHVHENGADRSLVASLRSKFWGYSPSDLWAVGAYSEVLHWNGSAWQSVRAAGAPTAPGILELGGSSSSDLWAVGTAGTLVHFAP